MNILSCVRYKIAAALILFLVTLFGFAEQAFAQPDSTIKVGIYQNPPKVFINENGNADGIFIEILEEMARLEGWKLEYVRCNWNDCLSHLENSEVDLMPDVAFSIERAKLFSFSNLPVIESWSQVYAAPGNDIKQISDLDGKSVALVEGSVQQPLFRLMMNGFGYQFTEIHASSFSDAFSEVKIGIADAAVANYFFGELNFNEFNLQKTPVIFNPSLLHFATPKGENAWLLETIDNYLDEWKSSPQSFYYQVLKKYNGSPVIQAETHSHFWYFFIPALIVFLFSALLFISSWRQKKQASQIAASKEKLESEKEKFRSYFENSPFGILITDEQGQIVEVNQVTCKITGYSAKELLTKTIPDLITENARNEALNHFNKVVNEGKASGSLPFLTKKGEVKTWAVDALKISETRFIGFVNDITDSMSANSQLDRLSKIFHQSVNEIYLFNATDFHFVDANEAALKNTGYSLSEMKQMTPMDLKLNIPEKEFNKVVNKLISGKKQRMNFEAQHFRKDGTFYEAELHLQLMEYDNKKLFLAFVLDITERKKAENELKKFKDKLEKQVGEKTNELNERIEELESFREATIERELRMEELRKEIELLKKDKN
jgi:PAS domain S-box-containing protein